MLLRSVPAFVTAFNDNDSFAMYRIVKESHTCASSFAVAQSTFHQLLSIKKTGTFAALTDTLLNHRRTFAAIFDPTATGNMRLDIHTARKAKQKLTADQQAALTGKEKKIPSTLVLNTWHALLMKISGDELTVTVDGQVLGALKSPGIAHPTKKMLRLAVPRNAVVDDVKIWRKS
jgi:hypothetical protein